MEVAIRADATTKTGAGHIMRTLALAESFRSRGMAVTWISSVDVPWVAKTLDHDRWIRRRPRREDQLVPPSLPCAIVVIDSYSPLLAQRQRLLDSGAFVVSVVDESCIDPGPASLWVNPGPPIESWNLDDSRFLNGLEFLLMRTAIRNLKPRRTYVNQVEDERPKVAVLLGGTDYAGLSDHFERVARDLRHLADFRVVAPGIAPKNYKVRDTVHALQALARAEMVISASGVSAWEMMYLEVPLALFVAVENQIPNYQWLTSNANCFPLGLASELRDPSVMTSRIEQAVSLLRSGHMQPVITIDGLGAERVALATINQMNREGLITDREASQFRQPRS